MMFCRFGINGLYYVEIYSLYTNFLRILFIINGYWILSKAFFLHLLKWSCDFILCFVNVVYNIDWLADIEPSLHSCNKSHWVIMYDPFFYIVEFSFAGILLRIFVYLYSSEILACNFIIYCSVFICFWYQGNDSFVDQIWESFFLLNFLE